MYYFLSKLIIEIRGYLRSLNFTRSSYLFYNTIILVFIFLFVFIIINFNLSILAYVLIPINIYFSAFIRRYITIFSYLSNF